MPPILNKEKGKAVLFELKAIFADLGVDFFLIEGTCLGAFRDGDFCEGDKDIDVGVKQEEILPKFNQLKQMLMGNGFQIKIESSPFDYERAIHATKDGVRVDVMDYAMNGDERFCANGRRHYSIVHDARLFSTLQEISFLGGTFLIPYPTDVYLSREYGSNWQTPDPNFTTSQTRVYNYWRDRVKK